MHKLVEKNDSQVLRLKILCCHEGSVYGSIKFF